MSFLDSTLPEEAPREAPPAPRKHSPAKYLLEKAKGERLPNGSIPLKRLTYRHVAILQMHLLGEKGGDIAEHFGVRPATVSRIIHDPLGQAFINARRNMDNARFDALFGDAVQVLKDGMHTEQSMGNRLKAASIYLDRKDKVDAKHGTGEETAEDVIAKILSDPMVVQNLTVQVQNNYGPQPAPKVIEQEKEDESS